MCSPEHVCHYTSGTLMDKIRYCGHASEFYLQYLLHFKITEGFKKELM